MKNAGYSAFSSPLAWSMLGQWEHYQHFDRLRRYCLFKLGRIPEKEQAACTDPRLRAELEAELEQVDQRLDQLRQEMEEELSLHPVWPWLQTVKGIGPIYGFFIIATVGDIRAFRSDSALRAHAGIGLGRDGRPQGGRIKGRTRSGGFWPLAQTLGLAAFSLVRQRSEPYYSHFRSVRERFLADGQPKHVATAAGKLAMKRLFLSHYFKRAREAYGLPAIPPYAERLGHGHIPPP